MTLGEILREHAHDIALVIGNGIHRHGAAGVNSWDQLLIDLARQNGLMVDHLPQGATATEFYDLIDLRVGAPSGGLAASFCIEMSEWPTQDHHRRIMGWAVRHRVPVMTTNFDEVLSRAVAAKLMRPNVPGFTSWYPWDSRFAHELHDDPRDGFGVWHINGLARYRRSVRLGLTHYIGLAHRAREWLHRGGNRLFAAKDKQNWPGRRTWLHLMFNKPLLFLGLGLREDEVFLRWLLIERERYFRKFPDRRQPGWFVFTHEPKDESETGRIFFLEGIGVKCVRTETYFDIYDIPAWQH
jgi:hypothetical protein